MIIAECCTNWKDLNQAREMIKSAKENGAGLAKFQLFDAGKEKDSPWFDWLTAHELTYDQAKMLFDYGREIGMEVFFSVFDPVFVPWCENIGVKRYKIASTWKRDPTELNAVLETTKPVIVSTPNETAPNISSRQLRGLTEHSATWLYCPPGYPPGKISMLEFHSPHIGFSDHTIGIDAAKVALARGAQIIEKHFILDCSMAAPDAPWSMTCDELAELVRWEKVCREVIN